MDETNLLLEKWLGKKNKKKEEKDKHPCLTCRNTCYPSVCGKIRAIPVIWMSEEELEELTRRTRAISIDWGAFQEKKEKTDGR